MDITNRWGYDYQKPENFPFDLEEESSQGRLHTNTVSPLQETPDSDFKTFHREALVA